MTRRLTPRQAEVVAMIVADPETSYEEMASALGISVRTARHHVTDAYRRLHVHSRTGVALWAIRAAATRQRYGWMRPLVTEPRRGHSEACGCSVCFVHGRQERRQGGRAA